MVTEDDILTAVRRGINTRKRLLIAFPKEEEEVVRTTIGTLVWKGLLKTQGRHLVVA